MISIAKGIAAQGASYFSRDDVPAAIEHPETSERSDYYSREAGVWFGKGAEQLNLSGAIKRNEFEKILGGFSLDGKSLVQNAGSQSRVAYSDMTISPPKSVSLMAVIDPRVAEAHRAAVGYMLEEIQKKYSLTRTGRNGVNQEITGSLVAAVFEHLDSREVDPQLHTHCVLVNTLPRSDGKWGAMENNLILQDQKMLDLMYQARLVQELHKLGYETRKSTRKGITNKSIDAFEISSISNEMIDSFSRRTVQVVDGAEYNKTAWKDIESRFKAGDISKKEYSQTKRALIEAAKLSTRKTKDIEFAEIVRLEMNYTVKERLSSISIPEKPISPNVSALEIMQNAVAELEENEAVFDRKKILQTALKISISTGITADQLVDEIPKVTLQLSKNNYTTERLYQASQNAVAISKKGQGVAVQCVDYDEIQSYLKTQESTGISFAKTQRQAIVSLCQSRDMVCILQGNAGTGKTFAVEHMKNILEQKGFSLRGFAPTGKACGGLEEVGLQSSTLDALFLAEENGKVDSIHGKEVWVIDECSMIGNIAMEKLLSMAQKYQAKVVLLGDVKQLQAISAGRAFQELQKYSTVTRSDMTEVIRQKTEHMKTIVAHSTDKRGDEALAVLFEKSTIHELKDGNDRLDRAVHEFVQAKESGRSVVVLAQNNRSREQANRSIREKLVASGKVEQGSGVTVLSHAGIPTVKRLLAENYSAGMIINLNRQIGKLERGTQALITSVDEEQNRIIVSYRDKSTGLPIEAGISLRTQGNNIQVYTQKEKPFGRGDEVIFLKNDKMLKVANGDSGWIRSIAEDGTVQVQMGKKSVKFKPEQYPYFDHGFAMTNYKAQGATYDQAVILCDNSDRTNAEEWYVGVTRARYDITVITDNIHQMAENIGVNQVKSSVMDFVTPVKSSESPFGTEEFHKQELQRISLDGERVRKELEEQVKREEFAVIQREQKLQQEKIEAEKRLQQAKAQALADEKRILQEQLALLSQMVIGQLRNWNWLRDTVKVYGDAGLHGYKQHDIVRSKVGTLVQDIVNNDSKFRNSYGYVKNAEWVNNLKNQLLVAIWEDVAKDPDYQKKTSLDLDNGPDL